MHLSQLLTDIYSDIVDSDPVIKGLCQDSRQLKSGELFLLILGPGPMAVASLKKRLPKGPQPFCLSRKETQTLICPMQGFLWFLLGI